MNRDVLEVPSKIRPYTVRFSDSWDSLEGTAGPGDYLCIVDENVYRLYQQKIPLFRSLPEQNRLILPIHEDHKTLTGVEKVYDALVPRSSKKNITLIAIGGGILQDVVGFAASTIYRGIRWVYVPTTLLAQSDSCIGGKTSINYKGYKNLLGTFYPPYEVLIFPGFLDSLSEEDYFSGLGEVVKLHLLDGKGSTEWYVAHEKAIAQREPQSRRDALQNSLRIKIGYIAEDEFDQGRRNMLNFGHCYGHALESASNFAVPHGQAVFVGMLYANIVARRRGMQSVGFEASVSELIIRHIVSSLSPDYFDQERILGALRKDKKRTGKDIAIILLSDNYSARRVSDLSDSEFQLANEELKERLKSKLSATAARA